MRFIYIFFILFYFLYLCLCFNRILCSNKNLVTMERALVIQLLSEWTLIWKTTLGVL